MSVPEVLVTLVEQTERLCLAVRERDPNAVTRALVTRGELIERLARMTQTQTPPAASDLRDQLERQARRALDQLQEWKDVSERELLEIARSRPALDRYERTGSADGDSSRFVELEL